MVTGDGNLVEVSATLRYRVADPRAYLFAVHDPKRPAPVRGRVRLAGTGRRPAVPRIADHAAIVASRRTCRIDCLIRLHELAPGRPRRGSRRADRPRPAPAGGSRLGVPRRRPGDPGPRPAGEPGRGPGDSAPQAGRGRSLPRTGRGRGRPGRTRSRPPRRAATRSCTGIALRTELPAEEIVAVSGRGERGRRRSTAASA